MQAETNKIVESELITQEFVPADPSQQAVYYKAKYERMKASIEGLEATLRAHENRYQDLTLKQRVTERKLTESMHEMDGFKIAFEYVVDALVREK
jgi:hypothetical protein